MAAATRKAVLVAGVLVWVGCWDDSTDESKDSCVMADTGGPPPVEPGECSNAPEPGLGLCLFGGHELDTTGHFVGWGTVSYGDTRFVADDGTEYRVWITGDEAHLALLPDLEGVPVRVVQQLDCHPYAGPNSAVGLFDAAGALIAVLGSNDTRSPIDGWEVVGLSDTSTCDGHAGTCWPRMHPRPLAVTHFAVTADLWQGADVDIHGHRVLVWQSESGSGEDYCSDVKGPELSSWAVLPL